MVENVDAMARKYQHNKHILLNRVKKYTTLNNLTKSQQNLQFNLIQFYMANEPKNIKNVPLILKKYKGREKKLKTILEKHYPNSYLVLPSAQSKKMIQARSTGSALKSAVKNAKREHKPSKLHYVDPAKTLQLDRKTCCTKQWKTCKACQLKISVDAFCERNVGSMVV